MTNLLTLAFQNGQMTDEEAALVGGVIIVTFLIIVGVMLAINVVICLLLYLGYKDVPLQHQRMPAWQVWLLLIPLFNYVWNFIVFQRIPESFQSYFASVGRTDQGDCGKQLGLWYAILVVVGVVGGCIPIVNMVAWLAPLAALVLMIIFIIKLFQMKGLVQRFGAPGGVVPPPAM